MCVCVCVQAQGLAHVLGVQRIRHAVEKHGVLLAAHGPYTAQGASQVSIAVAHRHAPPDDVHSAVPVEYQRRYE